MLSCPLVEKSVIRGHYNLSTPFYRLLWGPHIHHGYWEADESPRAAQLQLTERLGHAGSRPRRPAAAGRRLRHGRLVDPPGQVARLRGARRHDQPAATPLGRALVALASCCGQHRISLRRRGAGRVRRRVVRRRVERRMHRAFVRQAAVLRPGRPLAAAWRHDGDLRLARRRRSRRSPQAQQVYDVCEGFFCPSLGTANDYKGWMTDAGLTVTRGSGLDVPRGPDLGNLPRSRGSHPRPPAGPLGRSRLGDVPRSLRHDPRGLPQRRDEVRMLHCHQAARRYVTALRVNAWMRNQVSSRPAGVGRLESRLASARSWCLRSPSGACSGISMAAEQGRATSAHWLAIDALLALQFAVPHSVLLLAERSHADRPLDAVGAGGHVVLRGDLRELVADLCVLADDAGAAVATAKACLRCRCEWRSSHPGSCCSTASRSPASATRPAGPSGAIGSAASRCPAAAWSARRLSLAAPPGVLELSRPDLVHTPDDARSRRADRHLDAHTSCRQHAQRPPAGVLSARRISRSMPAACLDIRECYLGLWHVGLPQRRRRSQ